MLDIRLAYIYWRCLILLLTCNKLVLSAKWWTSPNLIAWNKSFIYIKKRRGPRIGNLLLFWLFTEKKKQKLNSTYSYTLFCWSYARTTHPKFVTRRVVNVHAWQTGYRFWQQHFTTTRRVKVVGKLSDFSIGGRNQRIFPGVIWVLCHESFFHETFTVSQVIYFSTGYSWLYKQSCQH